MYYRTLSLRLTLVLVEIVYRIIWWGSAGGTPYRLGCMMERWEGSQRTSYNEYTAENRTSSASFYWLGTFSMLSAILALFKTASVQLIPSVFCA